MTTDNTQTHAGAPVRSEALLAPFISVARGIPDNWPGECILRFDQREDGSLYLGYYGVNDASGGITIDQWRALRSANAPSRQRDEESYAEDDCSQLSWCCTECVDYSLESLGNDAWPTGCPCCGLSDCGQHLTPEQIDEVPTRSPFR